MENPNQNFKKIWKKLKNLEEFLNSESFDFDDYDDKIKWLECEDEHHHFILFFENEYYIVNCENDFPYMIRDVFDTLSECENYYFENYDEFNKN